VSLGRAGVFLEQRTGHEEYLVSLLPSVHLLTTLQHRQTIDSPFAARLSLDILPKLATSLDEQIEGRPTPRGDSARPVPPTPSHQTPHPPAPSPRHSPRILPNREPHHRLRTSRFVLQIANAALSLRPPFPSFAPLPLLVVSIPLPILGLTNCSGPGNSARIRSSSFTKCVARRMVGCSGGRVRMWNGSIRDKDRWAERTRAEESEETGDEVKAG